ncbi:MAG TPA: DnaJ family domain-containing protein [Ktedonobacterales bacterium]|nr:DnaJ family domain-containing protein [Ktedonobacterales bacterium]
MSSNSTPPDAKNSTPPDDNRPQERKQPPQRWRDAIEEQIRAAQERGDFDNLPGAGKPQRIDDNPYAGDRALAFHLLQQNDLLPQELDLGREVDADLARAEALLAELRRERQWLLNRPAFSRERARATYARMREEYAARYAEALRQLRSKILSLNIIAPSTLHRPVIDVEAKMRAFYQEFPPV